MEISKEQFERYNEVRKSGETNMFAVSRVSELSGLDKETIFYIMKNFGKLFLELGEIKNG